MAQLGVLEHPLVPDQCLTPDSGRCGTDLHFHRFSNWGGTWGEQSGAGVL